MFEFGWDQAAGLRSETPPNAPAMMPVASTAQPARAYELLCTLATHLGALGHQAVIIDGTASESTPRRGNDGGHLGLQHVLQDPSIAGLGRAPEGAEWLVMPGAHGLQTLQLTARAAGASVALARLLVPFSPGTLVLLYAPAMQLASLMAGSQARALVPVLPHAQASIDAYGSLKLLHGAGLSPVLAPLDHDLEPAQAPLQQVVQAVTDCARRHLGYAVDTWPLENWAKRVQASAQVMPVTEHLHTHEGQRGQRHTAPGARQLAAHTPWS